MVLSAGTFLLRKFGTSKLLITTKKSNFSKIYKKLIFNNSEDWLSFDIIEFFPGQRRASLRPSITLPHPHSHSAFSGQGCSGSIM